MLEAYAKLLKSAQVHGETEQQVGEFQSSVLVAGLVRGAPRAASLARQAHRTHRVTCRPSCSQVHATDNLLSISGELKRTALLSDDRAGHTSTEPATEPSPTAVLPPLPAHVPQPADELRKRLKQLREEMQQALHELEASYYAPPSVPLLAADTSRPAGLLSQQRSP